MIDIRYINAPPLCAEDKGYGVFGTYILAYPVADAVRGTDKVRFTVDKAEDLMSRVLRTGGHAGAATNAPVMVDNGMDGRGLYHARLDGIVAGLAIPRLFTGSQKYVAPEDYAERDDI